MVQPSKAVSCRAGRRTSPGAVLRGALAGTAGTAAMDLVQYLRYRSGGGEDRALHYEFSAVASFAEAPAPAQIAKRVVEGLFRTSLPDATANVANNVMHWGYGVTWGAVLALLAGATRRPVRVWWGPLFGTAVFLSDYVVLPPTGLYRPIWEYDATTLAKDWADHVVYGSVAAAAIVAAAALRGSRPCEDL
jgi:hypothetical protein